MAAPPRPAWVKDKKIGKDFEVIESPEWDDYKDFRIEPTEHYALIRIEWDRGKISVAICNKEHEILKVFTGRRPQDIYCAIFDYEQKNNIKWFTEKSHIAYLGKELKKAEMALAVGNSAYYQE
ncbi:DUF4346 domain-containing protein [Candidatus Woesearchaeota archaeon]|nr:DUF4346 domain-containing protein [Candidatus Woesearchaeota archaeon]